MTARCKHAKKSYQQGKSDWEFYGIYSGPDCECLECSDAYARGFSDGQDAAANDAEG